VKGGAAVTDNTYQACDLRRLRDRSLTLTSWRHGRSPASNTALSPNWTAALELLPMFMAPTAATSPAVVSRGRLHHPHRIIRQDVTSSRCACNYRIRRPGVAATEAQSSKKTPKARERRGFPFF